jgi:hypothetical protein
LFAWPPEKKNKLAFWDFLTAISEDFVSLWLYIRDFNFVLDQSKKLRGCPIASSPHCPFRNFIDHHGLVDLGFAGYPYTWCNNKKGLAATKERLDRAIASLDWVHLQPEFSLIHLPAFIYDHNLILLNTNTSSSFLPRPFKFEESWTFDPNCGLVIKVAWKIKVFGSPALYLIKKLNQTRAAFKRWNSLHFGNIQVKIKSTLASIDKIQLSPPSSQFAWLSLFRRKSLMVC